MHNGKVGEKEPLIHHCAHRMTYRSYYAVRQCTLVMDFPDLSSGLRSETVRPINVLPSNNEHYSAR